MARKAKVEFFKGKNGKWRWKLVARNGRTICTPGEDFSSRSKADQNFDAVCQLLESDFRVVGLWP